MLTTAEKPFVLMIKPVGPLCNMRCEYCYYSGADAERGAGPKRMSGRILELLIRKYIEACEGPVVQFIWHGGEPTLAGIDFYRRAVKLQKRFLPEGWSCWNNLQTNGLLLDDEWCSFLAEARFDVGISVDGTDWLHDKYRKDQNGNGTYKRVSEAIRRLKACGIRPDLLCTVTSDTAKEPILVYRSLRDFDTGWIQFIPIVRRGEDGRVTPDSVSGESYGDFLCEIFDEWLLRDLGRLDVQIFAEAAKVFAGTETELCWMARTCGRALVVEADGGVYSCDHFVTRDHRIGSIEDAGLAELVDSQRQSLFGGAKRYLLPEGCRSCGALAACNGGCPKDRFVTGPDGGSGSNHLCSGFKRFFTHAEQPLKNVIRLGGSGLSPARVMDELRAEAKIRWAGVGRNDPCPCGSGLKAKHCCWAKRPS